MEGKNEVKKYQQRIDRISLNKQDEKQKALNLIQDEEKKNHQDRINQTSTSMNNLFRTTTSNAQLLNKAAKNGAKNFNIFVTSKDKGKPIPSIHPYELKKEMTSKTGKVEKITNLRFTRNGNILMSTEDSQCAADLLNMEKLLNFEINARIIWENITTRFLVHNIPTSVNLEELYEELKSSNKELEILELRRFYKESSKKTHTPVLVTIMGIRLPERVKSWLTSYKTNLFVDRPRQCNKCFLFDHAPKFCKSQSICIKCGKTHSSAEECNPKKIVCVNCQGDHLANNRVCPYYEKECEILEYKCKHNLTIAEARRRLNTTTESKYAEKMKKNPNPTQKRKLEDLEKERKKQKDQGDERTLERIEKMFEEILKIMKMSSEKIQGQTSPTRKKSLNLRKESGKAETQEKMQLDFPWTEENNLEGT